MKTIYKVLLSFGIGICFLFAGISLGGLDEIYFPHIFGNWNFKWSPQIQNDINYTAQLDINDLEINVHKGNVQFQVRDDIDDIQIHASEIYNGFEIYQKDDKIVIEQPHYWRWFSHYDYASIQIDVPENFEFQKIEVNMSAGNTTLEHLKAKKIDVDVTAGRLTLNDAECQKLDLDVSIMGQAVFNDLNCFEKANVDVAMGDAHITLIGNQSDYNYAVDVGLGSVKIGDERFSGIADRQSRSHLNQRNLDVDCGFGNVDIEMEDH